MDSREKLGGIIKLFIKTRKIEVYKIFSLLFCLYRFYVIINLPRLYLYYATSIKEAGLILFLI